LAAWISGTFRATYSLEYPNLLVTFNDTRIEKLTPLKSSPRPREYAAAPLEQLYKEAQENPTNFPAALALAKAYTQLQQGEKAAKLMDGILASTNVDASTLRRLVE
jgi:hypothetical protein